MNFHFILGLFFKEKRTFRRFSFDSGSVLASMVKQAIKEGKALRNLDYWLTNSQDTIPLDLIIFIRLLKNL